MTLIKTEGYEVNSVYNENHLSLIARMPDNFIDLTITSPPYDGAREYKGYEFDYKKLAHGLYRVTKPGGVVVWVINDETDKGTESGSSFEQALYFKNKAGFLLHDTMIYRKPAAAYPASKKRSNRYSQVFEFMFVFSKGKPKTVNLIQDRPSRWGGTKTRGTVSERQKDGALKDRGKKVVNAMAVRDNIWEIANGFGYSASKDDTIAYIHPAIFPEALARDHIISWSNPGDLVFDPMAGSGTVSKMSIILKRNWIACEIGEMYCKEIIEPRLQKYLSHIWSNSLNKL